ncbi:MAG: hypothetical protein RIS36_722, partial [Pseudomonadota bacterium]
AHHYAPEVVPQDLSYVGMPPIARVVKHNHSVS